MFQIEDLQLQRYWVSGSAEAKAPQRGAWFGSKGQTLGGGGGDFGLYPESKRRSSECSQSALAM